MWGLQEGYLFREGMILQGDCLIRLKELPENSIDAIVTDPPYGLEFMGKDWDRGVPGVHFWQEMIRVLKPGGHLLAFGGTRTYHRMASAIEDAGFEIRDMIEWVYGSGFPKSLNIGKSVNQLETNEWSKIGKSLDNIDHKSIMEIWKSNSNNVKIVETQSLKNQIIAGQDTPSENFVVLNVAHNNNQENSNLLVNFAEQNLNEAQVINTKTNTALLNVEAEIRQLQNNVRSAEQQSQNQNLKSWSIFTAQCDVKEWLNENTEVNHKVDEALKTLRGNKKYSNEEIINVLCVALTDILKLTILNQSKTFQNLDTKSKMDCVSAINVIITEYTAENLISNTVAILKSKAVDKLQGNERRFVSKNPANRPYNLTKGETSTGWQSPPRPDKDKGTSQWEGWGTALKPAHEPICMARKPLAEKTVAENVLKWKTGGLNIDGSRVEGKLEGDPNRFAKTDGGSFNKFSYAEPIVRNEGRFPANIIHDNSEEVRECFPESKSGAMNGTYKNTIMKGQPGVRDGKEIHLYQEASEGNASRFFKSIIYVPKASKSERNRGLEEFDDKERVDYGGFHSEKGLIENNRNPENRLPTKNNHPTVKPIALMEYLIKMVTREGQIVLDPFMGSGSTGVACKNLLREFIGIEMVPEYAEIARRRIDAVSDRLL